MAIFPAQSGHAYLCASPLWLLLRRGKAAQSSGCKSVRPSVRPLVGPSVHVYHYTTGTPSLLLLKFSWCSPTIHNLNSSRLVETRSDDHQKVQEDTVSNFFNFVMITGKKSIAENLSTKGQGGNLILFTEFSSNWRIYEPWLTSGGDRGAWWKNWTQWNMLSSWAAH